MLNKFVTISNFKKISGKIYTPLIIATIISFLIGIYFALFASPPDYQQGELVRIMYIHVPAAWFSMSIYLLCALSGISFLVWKNPFSAIFLKSLIPIGISFCSICLITGSIWGRSSWGVYWVWDARLTSVLILLFLYFGLHILYNSYESEERSAKATAILSIIGIINLPIIKFSVEWWNTLHQPASLTKFARPSLHTDIMTPLLLMSLFYTLLFLAIFITKVKTELNKRKR